MAVQAGLAISKVILIAGAGLAGSMLVSNGRLADFLGDTYKIFMKHLDIEGEVPKDTSVDAALVAQVNRLRQELTRLATERSSITVVAGSSKTNEYKAIALPALIIGVSGYGYWRWKGFSLLDFMYVTRRRMSDAVASVSRQLEQVSEALAATKRQLASRLEHLDGNLNQSIEMQERLKYEVNEVHVELSRVGLEIETVQQLVKGLEGKINRIEYKQDFTNRGVVSLCEFVQQLGGPQQVDVLEVVNRPCLERSASLFGSSGARGLQYVSEALQPVSTVQSESEAATGNNSSSPILQRSYLSSFSFSSLRSSSVPRSYPNP